MDKKNNSKFVRSALREALLRRGYPRGVIFHSDRGSEYSSYLIQEMLRKNGFIVSMSRKGNCWDNGVVESFFKTLKADLINRINLIRLSLDEIRKECFDDIGVSITQGGFILLLTIKALRSMKNDAY